MLPIGDDDSARRTSPVVTYALIAFNVLFFLVELSAGDAFIERWSVVPRRFHRNVYACWLVASAWQYALSLDLRR